MSIKLNVGTVVSAGIDKVWKCWTEPQHIKGWNFASDDWHCPDAANDLRAGGRFSSRMEAKDGSFGFDFWGIYDEVVPFQKIAYTLGDGRKAVVLFEDLGDTCRISTEFEAESQNPPEMQQTGWQLITDNFKRYTESL